MKHWKRFLALAVSLILVLQPGVVFAAEPGITVSDSETEQRLELLNALGILDDDFSDVILSDRLSRADFAVAIARMFGNSVAEDEEEPESYYTDMEGMGAEAVKAVNLLTDKKMLSGTGNGAFEPNTNISYEQAVKIFVCALGYEMVAAEYGGFPTGFLTEGSRLGITEDISLSGNDALTWGGFISMLYQALSVDLMEQAGYGTTPTFVIVKGDTLLNSVMHVQLLERVMITGNHITNLNGGAGVETGYVEIDGKLFEDPRGLAGALIGKQADVYYTENRYDVRTIVYVRADYDLLTILLDDIEELNGYQITYYDEASGKEKTVRVADDATLVLNGQAGAYTPSLIDLTKSGQLVLERSASSSAYSVVTAQVYANMVVAAVDYGRQVIYDEMVDGKSLDLRKYLESERCSISKDGAATDINEITVDSILTIYEAPNHDYISITISDNKVSGTLDYYSADKVGLDGTSYKYDDSLADALREHQGSVFTAYLDVLGRIIWVRAENRSSLKYGYLIAGDVQGGFEDTVMLRILTEDGAVEEYTVASKIQLNDGNVSQGAAGVVQSQLSTNGTWNQQLIRYALNGEGKFGTLYTADASHSAADSYRDKGLDCALPKGSYRYKSSGSFYGKAMIDGNTKIFLVSPSNSIDPDDYQTQERSYFLNDGTYTAAAYNTDDGGMAEALVCWEEVSSLTPSYRSDSLMVDYISNTIDEAGNEVQELHGYTNGGYVEYVTNTETKLTNGTRDLKRGDVIRFVLNSKNQIAGITLDVDVDTQKTTNAAFSTFWNTYWAISGAFYSKEKNYAVISNTGAESLSGIFASPNSDQLYAVSLAAAKITIYDEEQDAVYTGTASDILTYKTAGEAASRFFMRFNYETPREVFLFKYKN